MPIRFFKKTEQSQQVNYGGVLVDSQLVKSYTIKGDGIKHATEHKLVFESGMEVVYPTQKDCSIQRVKDGQLACVGLGDYERVPYYDIRNMQGASIFTNQERNDVVLRGNNNRIDAYDFKPQFIVTIGQDNKSILDDKDEHQTKNFE